MVQQKHIPDRKLLILMHPRISEDSTEPLAATSTFSRSTTSRNTSFYGRNIPQDGHWAQMLGSHGRERRREEGAGGQRESCPLSLHLGHTHQPSLPRNKMCQGREICRTHLAVANALGTPRHCTGHLHSQGTRRQQLMSHGARHATWRTEGEGIEEGTRAAAPDVQLRAASRALPSLPPCCPLG
jgi:hypothetical protein